MAIYPENDPGPNPALDWLSATGTGVKKWFNPENRDALDAQGRPVVGPRMTRRDIALDGGIKSDSSQAIATGQQRAADALKKSAGDSPSGPGSKPALPSWTGQTDTSGRPEWLGPQPSNYVEKRTGPLDNLGTRGPGPVRTGPATTAPQSLNTFKFTEDPWGTPSTLGQMEQDFSARAMLQARDAQARQSIDERQASRPDSTAEAVRRAQADAALAELGLLKADPFAPIRMKTDEGIRAERGRQGAAVEAQDTKGRNYMADVQQEMAYAQAAKEALAKEPMSPDARKEKEAALEARLSERLGSLEKAYGYRKVTARAEEG